MEATVSNVRVRHGYERERVQLQSRGLSLTKQAFKDECDINNIMKRFERDGMIAHVNRYGGHYGDFTSVPEYHDAQNKIISANAMFMTLPAKVREKFNHDPGAFLQFVGDPRNEEAMVEMGLARARPKPVAVPEAPPDAGRGSVPSKG